MKDVMIIIGISYLSIISFCLISLWLKSKWLVQDYPKHLEEFEENKLKNKFDEYKKSQE